ncbi:hypothetical protein TBLA_0I03120 [Henningerozyma blattae CBS 6284]|uniref:Fatty acid synthase subunit beta n=1 Tax=Henningerozyma blattae (strain ATCC 34711 / CBS 6284 / DSM 70876 / NBRC 10599 / NRRL Y-10934 / UCD 77-7) TaxID=1071380 RepID=I2H9B5_HENB6|nr:hypothetical protein TBLA_0I03120 [Tetrapisispora blattae CBS 6284]CCH62967.1 hypothetical protein TBLA_0I03120 [Tetrapisispora blattae CBS 6284]
MSVSTRSVTLTHGALEHAIAVPASSYFAAALLKDQFQKTLVEPSPDYSQDEEPVSAIELLGKFLGYVSDIIENSTTDDSTTTSSSSETSPFNDVLRVAVHEFENSYLLSSNSKDIHSLAVNNLKIFENTTLLKSNELIKNYIKSKIILNEPFTTEKSALLDPSLKTNIFAIFGGQGNTDDYFEELRYLYDIYYPLIKDLIESLAKLLLDLSTTTTNNDYENIFTKGFNLIDWLKDSNMTPNQDYLLSIPISCPLIGIIQFAHYMITAKLLNLTPGELASSLKGATGHSQGLVTAVAIAESKTWDDFFISMKKSITLLFYIGVHCHLIYPNTSLPNSIVQDSLNNNEGLPSPMLSITNLSKDQVKNYIKITNDHLPAEKHISISLINGARNMVISGPPQSLYGLNLALRKEKAPPGLDQSRIPYTERKLKFSNRFLPITSPFHCHLLTPAQDSIVQDLLAKNVDFNRKDLNIPVFDTFSGKDLQSFDEDKDSILARIVKCIITLPVNWETTTNFNASHILDFGPGGSSGLGILTHRNKDGTGVRIIIAGNINSNGSLDDDDNDIGYKNEIFNLNPKLVKFNINWLNEFKPKLIKNKSGKIFVQTKYSKLIGKPPILVPGMTPTTVSPDFVASTINAGYTIELAGGGYFSPVMMTNAIDKVISQIKKGTSLGINLIYVNPRMLQWGIPLIRDLRSKGYPIQFLTIGAGVPSLEIATEYIETLGLTHLNLKPGSIDSISQVINIAKHHQNFPIVVQWTGGRAGGHHSFEDFHAPMLQMYSKLRKYKNIILIAGSGFGSSSDTYPYLTGEWSTKLNYPPMPFDGFLFGSRVMVAKEAKTSLAAKELIVQCKGVEDSDWTKCYKKSTGGILTVRSEMGEPIHKIATRWVVFWKELDDTIFNLPKNKLLAALDDKREYIIKKLNEDTSKPWFPTVNGEIRELNNMTYKEVAYRLVELMFIKSINSWIDVTLRNFVGDFLRRVEERFTTKKTNSILQSYSVLDKEPLKTLDLIFENYPNAKDQYLNAQDVDNFLNMCLNPFQKPVPFVPILDERFEFFFKKDSLWQSEHLEAVIDEDVQRTCILQGPVATKASTKVNEPIKNILDEIHDGQVQKLLKDYYNNDVDSIPTIDYFGGNDPVITESSFTKYISKNDSKKLVINSSTIKNENVWFNLLAGTKKDWRFAFFNTDRIVQDVLYVDNPIRDIFRPKHFAATSNSEDNSANSNLIVEIENYNDSSKAQVTLFDKIQGEFKPIAKLSSIENNKIELKLIENRSMDNKPVKLSLLYHFNNNDGFAPIIEIMENRNNRIKEMYWKLWLNDEKFDLNFSPKDEIINNNQFRITSDAITKFTHAIGNNCEDFVKREGRTMLAPMDFAIVVGWRVIIKAIFPETIDGDLLKLVHLSNGYRMIPGATPLKEGDLITTSAVVKSIVNQPTGKVVEVIGTLSREGSPVMEVTSSFFYRGNYTDFQNTFQKTTNPVYRVTIKSQKDIAVLHSKEWFQLDDEDIDLLDKSLSFETETEVTFKDAEIFSSVKCHGLIKIELPTREFVEIGVVDYEASESFGNPVIEYLKRNGSTLEHKVNLENPIPIGTIESQSPNTNEKYARISGDLNPIHVSRHFATYAQLPGTITHGMYSSAAVRSLIENAAADNVSSRVRAYSCNFANMVLPNTPLKTTIQHVGMINGRKLITFETKNDNDVVVLTGEAEIEQPVSAFVFTGQGSQEQGMGMDLYENSEVARNVWDRADAHFKNTYGFSILEIVKTNPNELTIYFGGEKGKKIRKNYTQMIFETIVDGSVKTERIFKEIDETTTSYTFRSPTGLLSATQFTQPALTLMEKASFEDLKSKGLIPVDAAFAGHSLGEYAALASLADVMSIESLVEVVFYRGMTMQVAVPRDEVGRSNYGMIAVNPGRVSPTFTQEALQFVVEKVGKRTQWLCEIVNYNVEGQQYVAAGDLRGLDTLNNVLNFIKVQKINIVKLQETMSLEEVEANLFEIIDEVAKKSLAKPQPIELQRGFACIPLPGISVPFHSSYLRNGVKPFKSFLTKNIIKENVKVDKLVGKYIPNLTAKPFAITKEYFQDVYNLTGSDKIKDILDNWESYENK